MASKINEAVGTAKDVMGSAKGGAEHAASSARSSLLDAAKVVVRAASTVRGLGFDDVLGWVGLMRRRSPLGLAGVFGAGVAVGAGVGLLLAPSTGTEMRRALLNRLDILMRQAGDKAKQAGNEVKQAERKVEEKVSEAARSVKGKIESAEERLHDTAEEMKSGISTGRHSQRGGFEGGHNLS